MGKKKKTAFFVVLIAEFRLWSGLGNRFLFNIEREPKTPSLLPWDICKKKKYHQKDDKLINRFIAAQSKSIRKTGIYAHARAFRIQSTPGSCLGRRF